MKSFKRWCEDNGREYTPEDYETFVSNAKAYNKYREQAGLKPQKAMAMVRPSKTVLDFIKRARQRLQEAEHDTD